MDLSQVLFIHVPKCAGSAFNHIKGGSLFKKVHSMNYEHKAWDIIVKKGYTDYYKFAFVRNPYDRFVSLYFYFHQMQPNHWAYQYDRAVVETIQEYESFESFCLGFDKFKFNKKFHFKNQTDWIANNDDIFVDFLGKVESIETDLIRLCKILEVPQIDTKSKKNNSNHQHYEKYYNDELRKIVSKLYEKDFELLDYEA